MARVCPLFSGSSGNSTYIKDKNGGILIDAGSSYKSLCDAVAFSGGNMEEIRAVLITHEHVDHIKCIKTLLKKNNIPLFASCETIKTLVSGSFVPEKADLRPLGSDAVSVGDFGIERFDTSHDCAGSSGYCVYLGDGRKVTICTDLGTVTDTVREHIKGSELLLFESNHDVEMLRNGPYPPQLKLRILSDKGHLSNIACASELAGFLKSGTTRFVLGHLSQHNNIPMLALSASRTALCSAGAKENEDYILSVAKPSGNGVIAL